MRHWTSDTHFGHYNIIEFCNRPFWHTVVVDGGWSWGPTEAHEPDVEAMNEALIDNWNSHVDQSDEVWVVGDFAMGHRKTTVPLAKRLHGRKFLVPGNHDNVHHMYPKWRKFVGLYEDAGFTILDSQVTTEIDGTEVLVCHFPYFGDSHHEDRYSGLRPDDVGGWLIHGHTHSDVKVIGRQIHVGVDAWDLRPASEDEIAQIIREAGED